MPQPIEQNKSRLSLESRFLKYKSFKKIQSVKVKMPPKSSVRMLQRHSFYTLKACLISFDSLIHTSAFPFQQCCMCGSSRHTSFVHTWYWEPTPTHCTGKLGTVLPHAFEKYNHWTGLVSCKKQNTYRILVHKKAQRIIACYSTIL